MDKAVQELSRPPWNIEAIRTYWAEYAWKYSDFPEIMQYFQDNSYIVLGGDILSTLLEHTYDNWYYNPDPARPMHENIQRSLAVAKDYLTRYGELKGTDHNIVFVVTRRIL